MGLKRFEKLRSISILPTTWPNTMTPDKLFKTPPFAEAVQNNCRKIPYEESFSVDEQMIPYKERHSLKQYLPKKPHRWGFKLFVRAGISGICYDFELYIGKRPEGEAVSGLGITAGIVLRLAGTIPNLQGSKLYFY